MPLLMENVLAEVVVVVVVVGVVGVGAGGVHALDVAALDERGAPLVALVRTLGWFHDGHDHGSGPVTRRRLVLGGPVAEQVVRL